MALILLQIGVIYFLGHLFAFIFKKYKIPDVLLFMLLGLIFGPLLNFSSPGDFGGAGPVLSTLALVVILFESGTTLNMQSLAKVLGSGSLLTIITFIITGVAAFLLSLPFTHSTELSILIGCILSGTSSAVVIPMANALGISDKPKNILLLESALTDVLCIVLTLALTRAFINGQLDITGIINQIGTSFIFSLIFGVAGGIGWVFLKQKMEAQFATIAFAIIVYSFVELIGLSGPIAVMSMGVALANTHKLQGIASSKTLSNVELGFYSELVFVLKTFFFIFLGISMQFDNWQVLPVSLIFISVLVILRYFMTKFLFRKSNYTKEELSYVSLLIPKGLAAAVLASVPLQAGVLGAEVIPQFVYPCVLTSIVVVSLLIPFVSKKYGPRHKLTTESKITTLNS